MGTPVVNLVYTPARPRCPGSTRTPAAWPAASAEGPRAHCPPACPQAHLPRPKHPHAGGHAAAGTCKHEHAQ
eukprot:1149985-Pelagomonas_calceolata.AAC.1